MYTTLESRDNTGHKYPPHRKASVTDYDKPLSIAAGSDSFAAIDLKISRNQFATTLEEIKQIYAMRFPQVPKDQDVSPGDMIDDPASDPNFNEPIVDRLRLQREQVYTYFFLDFPQVIIAALCSFSYRELHFLLKYIIIIYIYHVLLS